MPGSILERPGTYIAGSAACDVDPSVADPDVHPGSGSAIIIEEFKYLVIT
jgi:hypothetical protein